jgi:predicted alpha/beta hydrolase
MTITRVGRPKSRARPRPRPALAHLRPVTFQARDGFTLHADLYEPESPQRTLLIAPAMSVPRAFYGAFASYLAEHGIATLVVDYRGIGDSRPASLRGFRARLREWAEFDLEGALDFMERRHAGLPIALMGHSIGGQLLGLVHSGRADRVLLVAAQTGHPMHFPWHLRPRMFALWYVVIPGLTHLCGYLPMGLATGSGIDLPAGVSDDWTRWARSRDYVRVDGPIAGESNFESFQGPVLSYAFADDELAPVNSVSCLLQHFRAARRDLRPVTPSQLGAHGIGHFAAFRPAFRETLWERFRAFLEAQTP